MPETVKAPFTPAESGLLDAGQWATKVQRDYAAQPAAVVEYLRGFVSGCIHFLGQVDGHGKTGDFATRCGAQQNNLQAYDDAARATRRAPIVLDPPEFQNGGISGQPLRTACDRPADSNAGPNVVQFTKRPKS